MSKIKIAVDLDDVLTPHIEEFIKYLNKTYKEKAEVTIDDFKSDSWLLFGGTDEDDIKLVHGFYETDDYMNAPAMEGAYEVLKDLRAEYDLSVVTSRPQKLEALTRNWINKNFPDIFTEIKLGNIWALEGRSISKPEMCQMIGAKVLIDDSIQYALQCVEEGIGVLLFNDYPWNKYDQLPEKILRVNGWTNVKEKLQNLLHIL
jgi:5'(3')-deoxyribonucleotidase